MGIRKSFFSETAVVKHWNVLPMEALEVFKGYMDVALKNMI